MKYKSVIYCYIFIGLNVIAGAIHIEDHSVSLINYMDKKKLFRMTNVGFVKLTSI